MSSGDTAWLRMDSETNLMMITGVVVLRSPVTLEALRDLIEKRFACFERFRTRPWQDVTGAYWQKDPAFAIENHVVALDAGTDPGQDDLERLTSELASTPLDRAHPLWQFSLIENYAGGSALINRIHHCYADGIALIQVLMSMTDTTATPTRRAGAPPARPARERGVLDQVFHNARAMQEKGREAGRGLLRDTLSLSGDSDRLSGIARKGGAMAADLARFVLRPPDTRSRYRGKLSPNKHVAWSEPLPLDDVKALGKAYGCTVNDVLLSSVAGALRSWLDEQGDPVDGLEIHATVPVNLRRKPRLGDLGNKFGLVFLGIPVGIADPVERLYAVSKSMRELKQSYEAKISLGLLSIVGRAPSILQRPVLQMFSDKATAVMTNVPGPQQPLYMAGSEVDQLLFWVPQSGRIGLGVSILSYNGKVQFGLMTDRNLVARPGQVIRRVGAEFEKLVMTTMMAPWPGVHPDKGGSTNGS